MPWCHSGSSSRCFSASSLSGRCLLTKTPFSTAAPTARIHTRAALVVEADDEAAARALAWPSVRQAAAERQPSPTSAVNTEPENVRAAKAALFKATAENDTAAVATAWEQLRAVRTDHATALSGPSGELDPLTHSRGQRG